MQFDTLSEFENRRETNSHLFEGKDPGISFVEENGIILKTWGPSGDYCAPGTFNNTMRARKVWEDWLVDRARAGRAWRGNWLEGQSVVLWTSELPGLNQAGDLYFRGPWASICSTVSFIPLCIPGTRSVLEWFWTSMQEQFQKRSVLFLTQTWCLSFHSVIKTSELPQH